MKGAGLSPAQLTALNLDKSGVLVQLGQRYAARLEGLLGELQFAFVAFVYGQSLDGGWARAPRASALLGSPSAAGVDGPKACRGRGAVCVGWAAALRLVPPPPPAGFRQWKALLQLWLSCEDAPLASHAAEYVLLLRAVRAQLQQGLGGALGGGGGSAAAAAGLSPMGVPLVEELLPDSFLRHSFGLLLELLQECQAQVSRELWAEVGGRLLVALAGRLTGQLLHPIHIAQAPRRAAAFCPPHPLPRHAAGRGAARRAAHHAGLGLQLPAAGRGRGGRRVWASGGGAARGAGLLVARRVLQATVAPGWRSVPPHRSTQLCVIARASAQ